ncbi:MAG TPA: M20/M25/M40 family metallo-hydrolase, partial [Terriglobales bacterium]|nr:M20/M25/M40 family metallo-hydrolase [Terriglobales bacterium]
TLAQFETGKRAAAYRDLGSALQDPAFRNEFFQDPIAAALVRTTIAPTVLNGSSKTNVIPREASADLDCRLLPGEDPDGFVRTINGIVDDDDVAVEVILNFPPSSSATDTPLFRAIREVGQAEGAVVVPKMLRGFTDSHFFRAKGIASYGFIPFDIGPEDDKRMHGIDERVSTTNLREGTRRLVEILTTLDRIDRM